MKNLLKWFTIVLVISAILPMSQVVEAEETSKSSDQNMVQATINYGKEGNPSGKVANESPFISYFVKLSSYDVAYSISMFLNGKEVEADYSENTGLLTYQASDLSGANTVKVIVKANGLKQLEQSWDFTVDDNKKNPLEGKDTTLLEEVQSEALNRINEYRENLALPTLSNNAKLQETAQAHSNYMLKYENTGHKENSENEDFFTGVSPQQRTSYFGYENWYVGEGITYEEPGGKLAVDHLFDAPYHRLSLMNPFFEEAGTGYNEDGDFVVNFGGEMKEDDRVVLYPYHQQQNSKISWFAYESPNPLRNYDKNKIWTGYPISYTYYGPMNDKLVVENATLTNSSGEEISTYSITPEQEDHGKHHVFLIPKKVLSTNEQYTVNVNAYIKPQSGENKDVSRTWTFTTASTVDIQRVYLENHNETNFLTVEWASGTDPNAEITLKKDGNRYIRKEGREQTTYRQLTPGTYTMNIQSPHFEETKMYTVTIEEDSELRYDYDSSLQVTNLKEGEVTKNGDGSLAPEYSNYSQWKAPEDSFDEDKDWTVQFNTGMEVSNITDNFVYVIDEEGNKVSVSLDFDSNNEEISVNAPSTGYDSGEYKLVIEPLKSNQGVEMTKGITMPFTIK
ncbi:hypothetical protein GLW08_15550 [Pontibacillus yanchengensis]|uniref:Uncharacterized protein n=2 Tax=Pontibacillus yanchengensis TaxID=462910 RepID=A0ACC7VJF5_9BACI|nr:CAP domain-containing protein [Pontibacillus yanchengensis]MYL34875.1 hypothetical protein [Pontibacillus yanchengensis]MYL54750.1 hypothetical protein [Pontibacillus yanchengensis]